MPYTVDAAQDGCYEGTSVLINKFDVRDEEALSRIEAMVVPAKAAMWEADPQMATFDFAHYRAIHRWLFSDLYEWAGQVRTIDLSKKGTIFCPAKDIDGVAHAVFRRLQEQSYFIGLQKPAFVKQLTDFYQRTNELHPFREGNGRTQRLFLSQLCRHAGYKMDFSRVGTDLFMIATIQAAQGTDQLLQQVIEDAVRQDE